jgi:hypothetical protein
MTITPLKHFNVARRARAPAVAAKFPRRPGAGFLSETIPLFYIGRNKNGLWVVREEQGRAGGIFLFKRSALRFATKHGELVGSATMLLDEQFELDVENRGNPLVGNLDTAMHAARWRAPRLTVFIASAVATARKFLAVDVRRKRKVA